MKRIRCLRPFVGLLSLISLMGLLGFATTLFAGEAAIDVTQFGAKADGETDDTASIQKAIDSVGLTGGTALFPPGTYRVTSVGLSPFTSLPADDGWTIRDGQPTDVIHLPRSDAGSCVSHFVKVAFS